MADQRDLHDIKRVKPATFDADIVDGHEVRDGRSLKVHSVEKNLQVKPYPQSTSFGPGVDGIGGTLGRFTGLIRGTSVRPTSDSAILLQSARLAYPCLDAGFKKHAETQI